MTIILGIDPFQFGADRCALSLATAIADGIQFEMGALELERLVFGWFSGRMIMVPVTEIIIEG